MQAVKRTRQDDEGTLVQRARVGDLDAFEALYRHHVDPIYSLCLRMTAEPSVADELCQRTFVKAWEHLPAFAGDAALRTWLHRIAVNQVLMHRRGRTRREARVLPMPLPEREVAGDQGALMDLERALARLPEGARTVFVLHDVEGYRHAEVADALGISVGTSKAQLHRARALLRKKLSR